MRIIERLLHHLPQPALERLIAWRNAYPNTPLQYLPLPVRAEVKQILTSAIAASGSKSSPTHNPSVSQALPPYMLKALRKTSPNTPPIQRNGAPSHALPRASVPLATVIGMDSTTRRDIAITQQAKQQGTYIIGTNGTGKTNIIKTMITSDIQSGLGLCVIEPHGDLTAEILGLVPRHRLNDAIYLDVEDWQAPFGLNIYEVPEPRNIRTEAAVASFVSHTFEVLWSAGFETPRLMQNLRAVTRTLIANPGAHFGDIPLLYSNEEVRARMLANVSPQILTFWEEYERMNPRDRRLFTESTLNKVTAFLDEPMIQHILAQSKTTINFRYIMDNSKILLIKLSPQFEEASRLIGAVLIGKILMTAFSRADTPENKRKQFNLYCDEFHRFASSDFATLISEARKFNISTILSHQTLTQLTEQNRASALAAGNIICFRVSGDDARVLSRSFDTTPTTKPYVIGEEAVRAPTNDTINFLLRKAHTNPDAMACNRYLEYLLHFADFKVPPPPTHTPRGHYPNPRGNKAESVLEGAGDVAAVILCNGFHRRKYRKVQGLVIDAQRCIMLLNEFFFEIMLRHDPTLPIPQEVIALFGHKEFLTREGLPGFLAALQTVAAALAKDPILVETGQYRPRLQNRTYSDMEGEISNYIANQENYCARVKLVNAQEYVIRTKPAPKGLTGDTLAERIEAVKRHMRALGYTRHYTEVIDDHRKRQEFLFDLGDTLDEDAAGDGDEPDEPPPGSFTLD
jgi:hypothetical protein